MMTTMKMRRVVVAIVAVAVLASCGRSRVVRPPSQGSAKQTNTVAPARISSPKYGATAVVQRGQTVYRIATENGITPLDLALWNNIPPPYTIYPGQRLRLYPEDRSSAPPPASMVTSKPVSVPVTPGTTPAAPQVQEKSPATSSINWRWPTEGQVITSFAADNPTRQGIDIAGAGGQPVRAAADGVVVYSGAGLVGYGELVIVKHNEQWLSAYGHNRARQVNEGALVKAGQQIAEMGRSGASRDMLHFEIRYNGKPVNPQAYLPKK